MEMLRLNPLLLEKRLSLNPLLMIIWGVWEGYRYIGWLFIPIVYNTWPIYFMLKRGHQSFTFPPFTAIQFLNKALNLLVSTNKSSDLNLSLSQLLGTNMRVVLFIYPHQATNWRYHLKPPHEVCQWPHKTSWEHKSTTWQSPPKEVMAKQCQ